jgi:hypothetical protein
LKFFGSITTNQVCYESQSRVALSNLLPSKSFEFQFSFSVQKKMSSRKPSISEPGPSRLLQGIIGSKANPQHNSMKIWRELNMPVSCYDLLKPNTFSLPEKLLRHSAKLKPLKGPHERKTKKGVKSELKLNDLICI